MANGFSSMSFTTDGLNLLAKAQTGTPLNFTRIGVGEGILNGQNVAAFKRLLNEVKSLDITTLIVNGNGAATIGGVLSNADLDTGFYWREIGIFAQDPDLGEILYGYANTNDGDIYVPDKNTSVFDAPCNIGVYVSNAQNITAEIDSSLVYATKQDITDLQGDLAQMTTAMNGISDDLETHKSDTVAHMTQAQKDQLAAAIPSSQKGVAGGVATLGADGLIPKEQLNLNFSGKLVVKVTTADSGSIGSTTVRVKNTQLGANYSQSLDSLSSTTFSLLDNHTYSVVLENYPSTYYGAAANVTIVGGQSQELDLVLKTEPDIVGWDLDETTGAVSYTDGAADHIPMTISSGSLDAGSWLNSWLTKMKPCMLKGGVVQYYFKNIGAFLYDYTKRADGTAADVTSGNDGDVMIEFPLVYYKFSSYSDVNSHTHITCQFSQIPQDSSWCANAFLDRNGNIENVIYMAAYEGFIYNSALRSISGQAPTVSQTIGAFRTAAEASGAGYEQQEWAKRAFVQALLPMLFKGLDSQSIVGKGVSSMSAKINTGTMNGKPLFWGDQTGTSGVKFCGIENFWGNIFKFADGLINVANVYDYKIYAPYNDTASGYTSGGTIGGASGQYIDTVQSANGYGLLPATTVSTEASSKFHDYFYKSTSGTCICLTGGSWSSGVDDGAWYVYLSYTASGSSAAVGAALSFTPQS